MTELTINADDLEGVEGKVVIVTGGASGIGLATSKLFASKGAKVIIADLRPPTDDIADVAFVRTDVTSWSDLALLFKGTIASHGRLDILVSNAGVTTRENTFSDILDDDGELVEPQYKCIDVNLVAEMNCIKWAIHFMRRQLEGGSIVVTASKAAYTPMSGPTYAASKAGTIGLMRALRNFLPPLNIRLNAVVPGFTETGMMPQKAVARLRELGAVIQPASTVAAAILFLAIRNDCHCRAIQVVEGRFRELESGYEAAGELIFGDVMAGRRTLGPEAWGIIRENFRTTV